MQFSGFTRRETRVSNPGTIRRQSLREQVREALRDRIVTGDLSPGQVVRESTVSQQMGVSRTPLREAMIQLEREGLLVSAPAKGFRVAPLNAADARDFFEMAAGLHAMALLEGGVVEPERMEALRLTNDELARETDPVSVVKRDSLWHALLIAGCDNSKITQLAEWLSGVLQRYEIAWARAEPKTVTNVRGDAEGHSAILDLIENGELQAATTELIDHWKAQTAPVLDWLE